MDNRVHARFELRERRRMKREVVIIMDEECNRNKWKLEIVEDLISGRNGIVRAANGFGQGKELLNGHYSTSTR